MRKNSHHRRRKPRFQRRTPPGAVPGEVKVAADAPRPVIRVIAYGPTECAEADGRDIGQLAHLLDRYSVTWINVDGLGDASVIEQLGRTFHLHNLALEDVVNVHQRAKVEPYEHQLFIVARMVRLVADQLETEQVSIFLGPRYVLTFQERAGDCFDPLRQRILGGSGRVRQWGADYLAYALLDAVIDSYYPVADHYADELERLDIEITAQQNPTALARLHNVRHDLLLLRRSIRPHRETINELLRDVNPLVSADTQVYLRDCYDHCVQLIDLLEVYREMCSDLREYHLSLLSNRMNEIMKVLTIIATIFIPLSFVAGVYGMNFNTRSPWNMPELNWTWGYPFALSLMAFMALGLVVYFWRKGWIGSQHQRPRSNDARPPGSTPT